MVQSPCFPIVTRQWLTTRLDATAHIAEEMRNPEVKAPWAISLALGFTYIAGFLFNIVLCFVMGDPAEILASPMEQPVAQIFYNVLGKTGGIFYTICAVIIRKLPTELSGDVDQLTGGTVKFVCFAGLVSCFSSCK